VTRKQGGNPRCNFTCKPLATILMPHFELMQRKNYMNKNKENKISYSNLALLMTIILFFLTFVEPENLIIYVIFKLTIYTGFLAIFIMYFVAYRNRIFLFAFYIFTLCWNIFLLTTPVIAVTDINVSFIKWYNIGLIAIAVIMLNLGSLGKIKNKYLMETVNLSIKKILTFTVGLSILIQLIMRI